ncbi:hypothetical protein M8C21_015059, partial [Ambrosia artemisiifolia]
DVSVNEKSEVVTIDDSPRKRPKIDVPEEENRLLMEVNEASILSWLQNFENGAFASHFVYCCRKLQLDPQKVNVNGGAMAIGHPLGATGNLLYTYNTPSISIHIKVLRAHCVATLLHEMKRRGKDRHTSIDDPEKHEIHNQYGKDALKEGIGGGGDGHDQYFFGGSLFSGGGGGSSRGRRKQCGEVVVHPLKVSLGDLYNGTSKKLSFTAESLARETKVRYPYLPQNFLDVMRIQNSKDFTTIEEDKVSGTSQSNKMLESQKFLAAQIATVDPGLTACQLSMDHSASIEEEVQRIKREHPDDDCAVMNDRVKGSMIPREIEMRVLDNFALLKA